MILATAASHVALGGEPPRSHLEPAGVVATSTPAAANLGLTLTRASGVLRQQLALKRGAGLVVDGVAAGSRAAVAGFAQHDVLVKLDDQLLVLPEQLEALLEAADPDMPLECTVLRGGREVVVPLAKGPPGARSLRGSAAAGGLRPTASSLAIVKNMPPAQGPVDATRLRRLADETLVRKDTDFQIRLTGGEETRLVVSDPEGRVVFNDTIDTPEGRSRMPPLVRDRVGEMERLLESRQPAAAAAAEGPSVPAVQVDRLGVAPIELR